MGSNPKQRCHKADLLAGSEAAEAITSSGHLSLGPVGPSVTVMGARGEEREGSWGSAKLQGTPKLLYGVLPAVQPPPPGLEDIGAGVGGGDFGQARVGEGVLVLVSLSQVA